ncbi:unnamed protein product, partial [marine sediment metagenome]
ANLAQTHGEPGNVYQPHSLQPGYRGSQEGE